jgi:cold shock CspA family protein
MAESFNKREQEKRRQQKQEEKERRKAERKANSAGGGLDNMIAYVDEFGRITDTPPDPAKRQEIKAEDIEIGVPKRVEEVITERTGRVDFFDASRGFGFIVEEGGRDRYFVHISGTLEDIKDNDRVTFELERGPKGLNAVQVKKV